MADNWPNKLSIKCPKCECGLYPVDFYLHATEMFTRKCRRCGRNWSLLVRPSVRELTIKGVTGNSVFHFLEWTEIVPKNEKGLTYA